MTDNKAAKALAKLQDRALWNALMLAKAGVHIFPVGLQNPTLAPNGGIRAEKFYHKFRWGQEATTDPERIVELFGLYPGSFVGIACGPSNLLVADIDVDEGLSGYDTLDRAGLSLKDTHRYRTLRLGEHYLYKAPKGIPCKTMGPLITEDGVKLPGVDTRATGGMLVYYGPKLTEPPQFKKAPEWLVVRARPAGAPSAPDLGLAEWFTTLAEGEPGIRAREAAKAVLVEGMGHGEMLVATNRLAELGSLGAPGIEWAVNKARERYTNGYPAYAKSWDDAMLDAAQYWGSPPKQIAIRARVNTPAKGKKTKKSKTTKAKKSKKTHTTKPQKAIKPYRVAQAPASHPEDFFGEKGVGLLSERLGEFVNYGSDLARGLDGNVWHYQDGVWVPDDEAIRARCVYLLGNMYRRESTGIARDVVLAHPDTPLITGDPHHTMINCKNGMLDWRTMTLLPHHPDHLSTVQVNATYGGSIEHPMFDRWLDDVVSPDLQVVVWELIAYSMLNGNPFQKAALLIGPGGAGKGTLIRLIEHIAGARNVSHVTPAGLSTTFEPANLMGKLLNTVGDLDGKYMADAGAFKRVLGGDGILAQHKNKTPFNLNVWAFMIFGANGIATSADATSGFFRRWFTVPFSNVVQYSRPFDEAALRVEADAIFTDAVQRLPELLAQGDFTPTVETMEAMSDFRIRSDNVQMWLNSDEHVESAEPGSKGASRQTHLYAQYEAWHFRDGHRNKLAKPQWLDRLRALGYSMGQTQGYATIKGITMDSLPLTQGFTPPTYDAGNDNDD